MENRAAVFTSQPQAVEVYQSGAWWPGELLGWRHDPDGACQVWVRVELGGVEESAWTDLTALRLPERRPAGAVQPSLQGSPDTRTAAPAASGTGDIRDLEETASLPLIRDHATAAARTGGRRRAPETGPIAVERAAGTPAAAAGAGVAVMGRHRAPADPGRHRAADTGILPAVAGAARGADLPAPRSARAEESLATSVRGRWGALDPEPEMLTRPMRLTDLAPHSRRPRLDGSLAGV
jgi:hypothetical protein